MALLATELGFGADEQIDYDEDDDFAEVYEVRDDEDWEEDEGEEDGDEDDYEDDEA
jgi:23S rRNA pseudouridine1911/1915/1917 synthase